MAAELLFTDIMGFINKFAMPLSRVTGFFLLAPVFGSTLIPTKIKLMTSLMISIAIGFALPTLPQIDLFTFDGGLVIAGQMLIGAAMGFVFMLTMQSFILGGQIIAMQAGLGFASMIDPQSGLSVPVVSQVYLLLVTLVFLALNGHLLFIRMLADSFTILPVGQGTISSEGIWQLVSWAKWMFKAAVIMALPAIISLLLVNFALGVMTRAAPQLNIFAVGFPITLTLAMGIIFITITGILPHIEDIVANGFNISRVILESK